jgi:hypothetical protein
MSTIRVHCTACGDRVGKALPCSLLSLCSSKEPKGNPSLPNLKSKPFPAKKLQKSKNQTQPIDEMRDPSLSFTKTHFS